MRGPGFLSRDKEQELAIRWRDQHDEKAMHEIVLAHEPLVRSMAHKFAKYMPREDALQEGAIGLLVAAHKFDPDRGVRFSTFAMWWVKCHIMDALLEEPTVGQSKSSAAKSAFYRGERQTFVMSIDAPRENRDGKSITIGSTLVSPEATPDEATEASIDGSRMSERLQKALRTLDKRERLIIDARFLSEEPETLEEVGWRLGVSKERVRQIENKALDRVRKHMGAA